MITGEEYSFASRAELKRFKYQRYVQKYLQCVHSIDENIGQLFDYLVANGLRESRIVIYTSDQGFYLGEHGWYDKRLIYEESFRIAVPDSLARRGESGVDLRHDGVQRGLRTNVCRERAAPGADVHAGAFAPAAAARPVRNRARVCEWELFDLERDPHELRNVYADLAYADVVRGMRRKLDEKMDEIGDDPLHAR